MNQLKVSCLSENLLYNIKFSQFDNELLAGHESVLLVGLSDCPDCLIDVLDALDPLFEIGETHQGPANVQSVHTLNFGDHLQSIVPAPNRVYEAVNQLL